MTSRSIALLLVLVGLPSLASAQLELPRNRTRPKPKTGPVVGPRVPRGDLAPRPDAGGGPVLPPGRGAGEPVGPSPTTPGGADPAAGASRGAGPATVAPGTTGEYAATPAGAAAYYLDQLGRLRDPASQLAVSAEANLATLGTPGLAACRGRLAGDHPVQLLVVGRVLIRHGTPEDRQAVVNRLWARLPSGTAEPLLDELVQRDPVLATPELLAALLDHPDAAMRRAAKRQLEPRTEPGLLPLLARPLASGRTSARLAALDLVAQVDDPSVPHVLAGRLDDGNARVAARAAELLSTLERDGIEDFLRSLVLENDPLDRRAAYALLALIAREDRRGQVLLDESFVTPLRGALLSNEPIVAGAAAAALAGIGFRSASAGGWEWLDDEVPYTLIRMSSGAIFHKDFTSLQGPAIGRLELISGMGFGREGAAWQAWWAAESERFRARRAVLAVAPGDSVFLRLRYSSDRWDPGRDLVVLGPAVESHAAAQRVVYLDSKAAAALVTELDGLGVLGAERLPGLFGSELGPGRKLSVRFRGAGKEFELAAEVRAPWLDTLVEHLEEIARANRWQAWGPVRSGSQRAFWEAERDFWATEEDALVRALRLKALVLDHLEATDPSERARGIAQLRELYREPGTPEPADFPRLVAWLEDEVGLGARSRDLVQLALTAAATSGERPRPAGATIDPDRGRELVTLLSGRFGAAALEDLEQVVQASGKDLAREVARDGSPVLRTAAAGALARDGDDQDVTLLFVLLRDEDEDVRRSAVRAVGRERVVAARSEVLKLADASTPSVRGEALIALARLGDPELQGLCLIALAEDSEELQVAAVEALATAEDPQNANVLASLFARGPDSPLFAPARDGLERLGAEAWPQLIRLAQGSVYGTRREAAFLLAEQGVPEAASILMTLLTEAPEDERVAMELAILSGEDLRGAESPTLAWWSWWDQVVHDDAGAWLRAAAERRGITAPAAEDLTGEGTRRGAEFLVEVALAGPWHLTVRACRELEHLLGAAVEVPSAGDDPSWRTDVDALIEARYEE